jgi:hypothetical protein
MYVGHIYVALPCSRQYQLLANIFAAAEKLETSEKRNSPVLENEKNRGFYLNQPTRSTFSGLSHRKGVMP